MERNDSFVKRCDAGGEALSLAERDVEAAVPAAPVPRGNTFPEPVDYIGAVRDASSTWWQGRTCGLEDSDPC
ncbi:MAG: hypothetical protein GDA39_06935 [Hyphomonadaceae bacterium]|nr:hypothetical protein [Hyphomonadaceae bacterium]MBC6412618.1 hypothetical protein [Hyphomonadaceae bacterium]